MRQVGCALRSDDVPHFGFRPRVGGDFPMVSFAHYRSCRESFEVTRFMVDLILKT